MLLVLRNKSFLFFQIIFHSSFFFFFNELCVRLGNFLKNFSGELARDALTSNFLSILELSSLLALFPDENFLLSGKCHHLKCSGV